MDSTTASVTRIYSHDTGIDDVSSVDCHIPALRNGTNAQVAAYDGAFIGTKTISYDTPFLWSCLHSGSLISTFLDGSAGTTSAQTLNATITRQGIGTSAQKLGAHKGFISEVIVYHSDQSANRAAIEANIGSRYEITTGYADLYLEALQTAGASPTSTQANAIRNFVRTGESAGWFSSLKRFYLPIWGAAGPNAIDLISRASGTFNGSVTHGTGYVQGDGSTGYFDFGVSPDTLGLTVDGGSVFALVAQEDSRNVEAQFVGCTDSVNRRVYLQQQSASLIQTTMYSASGASYNTVVNPDGAILSAVRSDSDRFIKVLQAIGTTTNNYANTNTGATCVVNAFAMAYNDKGGGTAEHTDARLGAYGLGLDFSETAADNYLAALQTLWETTTGLTLP